MLNLHGVIYLLVSFRRIRTTKNNLKHKMMVKLVEIVVSHLNMQGEEKQANPLSVQYMQWSFILLTSRVILSFCKMF